VTDWAPRRKTFDLSKTGVSREEAFVLAQADGTLSVSELADVCGLTYERVVEILRALVERGAVEGETEPAPSNDVAHEPAPRKTAEMPRYVSGASMIDTLDASEDEEQAPLPEEDEALRCEGDPRRLYESELRHRPLDERLRLAQTFDAATSLALCFDADPKVVLALLDNPRLSVAHARLIALAHRTAAGLERIVARADLGRDPLVARRLVRNPQLTEGLLQRIHAPRRLADVYKTSLDRDVPERTRAAARTLLRTRFQRAEPEERFHLVWSTDGRALAALSGCTMDSKTTALFCARTLSSAQLIQNLARWSAAPPILLAHLLKQPLVKRQPHLRNLILRHPNLPGDAKRAR
jgi:hypothetical protein